MKHFFAVLALILAASSSIAPAADYTSARDYVYPLVTAKPVGPESKQMTGSGSMVIIAPGFAITVAHAIPEDRSELYFYAFGIKPLRLVKIDTKEDLALVSGDLICPCAPIAMGPPSIDADVVAIGFPLYGQYETQFATRGTVQGWAKGKIVSSAQTAPGGSGGGLFVKEGKEYKLIGITRAVGAHPIGPAIVGTYQQAHWIVFSVSLPAIRNFLKDTIVATKLR